MYILLQRGKLLQSGAALMYYKLGQVLLKIGAAFLYCKTGQVVLKGREGITKWGNYQKVRQ